MTDKKDLVTKDFKDLEDYIERYVTTGTFGEIYMKPIDKKDPAEVAAECFIKDEFSKAMDCNTESWLGQWLRDAVLYGWRARDNEVREAFEAARARAEIAGMPGSESRFALFETFDDYLKAKGK